ncbi:all trans-polyprenyl-diphosphate synthase PDSS1-like isoform X2 [Lineus longissimus]|uniref:all trans-polyprenyl-diphosphate synthase PDSS1-like isoform X2 n=1 Tax=Lineus longissimus TaxID=88925 RepID=UPI00315D58C3
MRCLCGRILPYSYSFKPNDINGRLYTYSKTLSTVYKKSVLQSPSVDQCYVSPRSPGIRFYSDGTLQPRPNETTDPYQLVEMELAAVCDNIKAELSTKKTSLREMTHYHFDGKGKAFRPMLVLLLAKLINLEQGANRQSYLLDTQKKVAEIAEMIHVASLVHDDVIDASDIRRGKPSVHYSWGQQKAITAGDYILSAASMAIARIGDPDVVIVLAQVIEDLVKGEFMQLGTKEKQNERFTHYLRKTYKKTASLMANSCKAVAILGDVQESEVEMAYQIGRNIGIAFQLVDDMLDFTANEQMIGKPTAADLKLGLATAPVLFACDQYPELHEMVMRRFSEEGDVDHARECVALSDGVEQTKCLAESHCREAVKLLRHFRSSPEQTALIRITDMVLSRKK